MRRLILRIFGNEKAWLVARKNELLDLQKRIKEISGENDYRKWYNQTAISTAVDSESKYEIERRQLRRQVIDHDDALLAELRNRENKLKKILGLI